MSIRPQVESWWVDCVQAYHTYLQSPTPDGGVHAIEVCSVVAGTPGAEGVTQAPKYVAEIREHLLVHCRLATAPPTGTAGLGDGMLTACAFNHANLSTTDPSQALGTVMLCGMAQTPTAPEDQRREAARMAADARKRFVQMTRCSFPQATATSTSSAVRKSTSQVADAVLQVAREELNKLGLGHYFVGLLEGGGSRQAPRQKAGPNIKFGLEHIRQLTAHECVSGCGLVDRELAWYDPLKMFTRSRATYLGALVLHEIAHAVVYAAGHRVYGSVHNNDFYNTLIPLAHQRLDAVTLRIAELVDDPALLDDMGTNPTGGFKKGQQVEFTWKGTTYQGRLDSFGGRWWTIVRPGDIPGRHFRMSPQRLRLITSVHTAPTTSATPATPSTQATQAVQATPTTSVTQAATATLPGPGPDLFRQPIRPPVDPLGGFRAGQTVAFTAKDGRRLTGVLRSFGGKNWSVAVPGYASNWRVHPSYLSVVI